MNRNGFQNACLKWAAHQTSMLWAEVLDYRASQLRLRPCVYDSVSHTKGTLCSVEKNTVIWFCWLVKLLLSLTYCQVVKGRVVFTEYLKYWMHLFYSHGWLCFNVFQQSNAWWKLKTIVNCPLLTSQRRRLSWVQLAGHKGKPSPQKAAHFNPM